MGGTVTLGGVSVDQMPGSILMPMAAAVGVILFVHWCFDVVPAASAPASAGLQRRKASSTGNRLAANQTPLAHNTLVLTRADHGGAQFSAELPRLITTAIDRAIATHGSRARPNGDTAHTLTRGCA
jgi:hypothetical protein